MWGPLIYRNALLGSGDTILQFQKTFARFWEKHNDT
jgi:hypothetical protein